MRITKLDRFFNWLGMGFFLVASVPLILGVIVVNYNLFTKTFWIGLWLFSLRFFWQIITKSELLKKNKTKKWENLKNSKKQ